MIPMIKKDSYWHGAISWILPAFFAGFVLALWVEGEKRVFAYGMLLYFPLFIFQHLVKH